MDTRRVADRAYIYREAYESRQRDPVVDVVNRASIANGRMSRWERFNKTQELVWIDDAEGHPRALTPKQYEVYQLAASMVDGPMLTMRGMADHLHVSPSTVSRALAKLMSWGILVYMVGRGRWAGLLVMRYVRGSRYEYLRKAAKDRVRRLYIAAQRRLSRSDFNVAPYVPGSKRVSITSVPSNSYLGRNIETWTPEELRSAGVL